MQRRWRTTRQLVPRSFMIVVAMTLAWTKSSASACEFRYASLSTEELRRSTATGKGGPARLGFPTYQLAVILIDPAFHPCGRSVGCARCGGAFAQIGEHKRRTVQLARARAALDLGRGGPVLPIRVWRSADRPFAIVSVLDHVSSPSVSRGEKTA